MKQSKLREGLAFPVPLLYFFSGLIKQFGLQGCLQRCIHFKGIETHTHTHTQRRENLHLDLLSEFTKEATEGE